MTIFTIKEIRVPKERNGKKGGAVGDSSSFLFL